MLSLQMLQKK